MMPKLDTSITFVDFYPENALRLVCRITEDPDGGVQMAENVEPLEMEDDEGGEDGKRQRSTIAFPYTDYENAAAVAATIFSNVGHGACSGGQLAAWMGQSAKSSGFRTQLAAARLFGLIEN